MNNFLPPLPSFIDLTLTPENAESRGYELLQDTFYDMEQPDFPRIRHEKFYITNKLILGQPALRGDVSICYGLYRKITKTEVSNQDARTYS